MTEPSRSSPDTHGTEAESAGQLDVTLARPEGDVVLSPLKKKIREPEFDPPTATCCTSRSAGAGWAWCGAPTTRCSAAPSR